MSRGFQSRRYTRLKEFKRRLDLYIYMIMLSTH
jgi:hypothetical protein